MTDSRPLVHVVDDDDAVRHSLQFLFEAHGHSVRTYESGTAFLHSVAIGEGGCIVTDVRMPELNGIELIRRLREKGCALPVIVISGHGDVPLAVEAMKAGAIDFIEKPFEDELILKSVRLALKRITADEELSAERAEIAERMSALSVRERQVLDGLVAGHANKVIAFDLGISPRTVEVYRANVMTKMQADSLSGLVRMTLRVASK